MQTRALASIVLATGLLMGTFASNTRAEPSPGASETSSLVNVDSSGLAIDGYDPVAYFTDGKPVLGRPEFVVSHNGAIYHFASEEHRTLFVGEPSKYAPAFGGYCAYAASINKLSPIDPKFWEIVDGRLILQHNQKAWDLWHKEPSVNLTKADSNWPTLEAGNAKPIKVLVNVNSEGLALQGYDPVAYFTDGKPVEGSQQFHSEHEGATYRFASAEHKAAFDASPDSYTPRFGGYCGYAASINKVSPVDPTIWQIVDGRLVLQHTQRAYKLFNENVAGNYAKANENWPHLVHKKGK